jgi:hypothetical protein
MSLLAKICEKTGFGATVEILPEMAAVVHAILNLDMPSVGDAGRATD